MKKLPEIYDVIKSTEFSTKVTIYMSSKVAGDNFDPYEKNYIFTNLNPVTIKAYVRQVSPEALVYKQYGLHEQGALELITEARFKQYFVLASKVVINGVEYQVFKEGTGNRTLIQDRPYQLLRVILSRNG